MNEAEIITRLNELFDGTAWPTHRRHPFGLRFADHNSFFTSNIIAILDRCNIVDAHLQSNLQLAKKQLTRYRSGHLTHYWPVTDGQPTFFHSVALGKLFGMSPDADCCCLSQLADPDPASVDAMIDEVTRHRLDSRRFRLVRSQRERLPDATGTFLTWLPDVPKGRKPKLETIDIAVDANILWFLGSIERLDSPGADETIGLISSVLATDIILSDPFIVSPYYPDSSIILYVLSRAIEWGNLRLSDNITGRIMELARQIKPRTELETLCLSSVGLYLGDEELTRRHLDEQIDKTMQVSPFFTGHFGLGTSSMTFNLARSPLMQFRFYNESLQWAMLLWIVQNTDWQ